MTNIYLTKRKKISDLEIVLFIFTMVFTPQYLPIDIRYAIYVFWGLVGLYRGGMFTNITRYSKITMIVLIIITIYSSIVILLNGYYEVNLFLRYLRALVTLIVICVYMGAIEINLGKVVNGVLTVLLIHSVIIISEIIIPSVKDFMIPFSGESRMFYPYRANGFVNGYDYAGFYSNLGLLLAGYMFILKRKYKYLLIGMVCMVATVFTSRFNIILMSAVLIILLIKSLKEKTRLLSLFIFIMFFLASGIGIFLWAFTSDAMPTFRDFIFNTFYWADQLYVTLRQTYPDNNIKDVLGQHFILPTNLLLIFGNGTDGSVDPGYIQSIYSVGVIGTLIILFYYIYQLFSIKYLRMDEQKFNERHVVYIICVFILLFNIVGNLKIWFFFTTGIFELTSILIIAYELTNKKLYRELYQKKH